MIQGEVNCHDSLVQIRFMLDVCNLNGGEFPLVIDVHTKGGGLTERLI